MKTITTKKVGAVVVQRILHVPSGMKGNGLKRFLNTKQYSKEKSITEIPLTNKQKKEHGATPGINTMTKKKVAAKKTTAKKAVAKKAPAKKAPAKKKAVAKKAAPKKRKAAPKKVAIKKGLMRRLEKGEKKGKIAKIIELHRKGLRNIEIINKGYSPNTVALNVSLYKRGKLKIKY